MRKLPIGIFSLFLLAHAPAFADLASDATNAGYYKAIADAQSAELANIAQATKVPAVTNSVAAPTSMAATGTRAFTDALTAWLALDDNPIFKTLESDSCTAVMEQKDGILNALDIYRVANTRISSAWEDLRQANKSFKDKNSAVTDATEQDAAKTSSSHNNFSVGIQTIPPVLLAGTLINSAISYATLLKKATATASNPVDQASAIFTASLVAEFFNRKGLGNKEFIDSDFNMGGAYDPTILNECKENMSDSEFDKISLHQKINCLSAEATIAQAMLDKTQIPDAPKTGTDPNKGRRASYNKLKASIDSANTDLSSLLKADSATGLYPYNVAIRGELLNQAIQGGACLLRASIITANTDSVATDAWYSTYKLYSTTFATITWRISGADGKMKKAGFYSLSKQWHREKLQSD